MHSGLRLALLISFALAAQVQAAMPTALETLRQAAEHGDMRAALTLANAYRRGDGVPVDIAAAELWYARAARAGSDDAASELGLIYLEQNAPAQALPWLDAAARRGDARASGLLATLYVNGGGVEPDLALAYALTMRAAASGLPTAIAQLGMLATRLTPATIATSPARLRQWEAFSLNAQPPVLAVASAALMSTPAPAIVAAAAIAPAPPAVRPALLPASPPVALPAITPATLLPASKWQAQLGVFGSIGKARTGWAILVKQLKLANGAAPIVLDDGTSIRLRLAATSEADAQALCRRALTAGAPCLPVRNEPGSAPMKRVQL